MLSVYGFVTARSCVLLCDLSGTECIVDSMEL